MHISLQIIIAARSVMGFYFCLKTIASLIFTSKQIAAAVIIDSKEQLRELDVLLEDAYSAFYTLRKRRLAVFIPTRVWEVCDEHDKALSKDLIDQFDAELYII